MKELFTQRKSAIGKAPLDPQEQKQREKRLLELQAETSTRQNRKGLHIPHPIQERKVAKEIETIQKEIAFYNDAQKSKEKNKRILIGLGTVVIILLAGLFILAGKKKDSGSTNDPQLYVPSITTIATADDKPATTVIVDTTRIPAESENYEDVLNSMMDTINYEIGYRAYYSATRRRYCAFSFSAGIMTEFTAVNKFRGEYQKTEEIKSYRIISGSIDSGWAVEMYGSVYHMELKNSQIIIYNDKHEYLRSEEKTTVPLGYLIKGLQQMDPEEAIMCLTP